MNMKLPSVYANRIEKNICNNVSCYHGDRNETKDLRDLKNKFDNKGYVNRLGVKLYLKDGREIETKLVLCKDSYFIDINNEKIYFDNIKNYEIKK